MGRVYGPPEGLKAPELSEFQDPDGRGIDFPAYEKPQDKFLRDLKDWCRKHGRGEYAGEEIYFPVGDGSAVYIVLSTKPVQLVHAPIGDAWQFQYANRLTVKDIREQVERNRWLKELKIPEMKPKGVVA